MQVFFVRHGETGGNIARRHQADETPLTYLGEEQAREVAEEVREFSPTHLVCSRLVRAMSTARIIGEVCELVPETSGHFVELARPEHLYGHRHKSIRSFIFYIQWYLGIGAGKTKGEPYDDLRARIEAAREYLEAFPEDARVVVVSHAVFINFFVSHLCQNEKLGLWGAFKTFQRLLTMPNAEVVKLTLNESAEKGACSWSVES